MNKSENIGELAEALSKAQSQMGPAHKGQKNPFFKSDYANLTDCWEAARVALTENGLSVTQSVDVHDGSIRLITNLLHKSGQWISSSAPVVPEKPGAQALGSCLTYIRRYSFAALVGIVTDIDDDGNKSDHGDKKKDETKVKQPEIKTTAKPAPKPAPAPINANEFDFKIDLRQMNSSANCTPAQAQLIRTRMGTLGWDKHKQERFLKHIGCINKDGVVSATLLMKDSINQILNYLDIQKGLTPS